MPSIVSTLFALSATFVVAAARPMPLATPLTDISVEDFVKARQPFYTRNSKIHSAGTYEGANKLVVDLDKHQRNLGRINAHVGASNLWATIKGDAYGMGTDAILLSAILSGNVSGVGTAHIQEADEIMRLTPDYDFPIMVYAGSSVSDMDVAISYSHRVIPWIFDGMIDLYEAKAKAANVTLRVILVCNTGMNRYGVNMQDTIDKAVAQGKKIQQSPYLELFAVSGHFPVSDTARNSGIKSGGDIDDEKLTMKQIKLLLGLKTALGCGTGGNCNFTMANSGATLQYPETFNDANGFVRPGIIQYGILPNYKNLAVNGAAIGLETIFHMESQVVNLHTIYPGETVSYGRKYTCCGGDKFKIIATVPIGYCDGILGWADNKAKVFNIESRMNGTFLELAGKRSMDSVMLFVDDTVQLYDTVKIRFPNEDTLAQGDEVMPDFGYTSMSFLAQRLTRQYVFGDSPNNDLITRQVAASLWLPSAFEKKQKK